MNNQILTQEDCGVILNNLMDNLTPTGKMLFQANQELIANIITGVLLEANKVLEQKAK